MNMDNIIKKKVKKCIVCGRKVTDKNQAWNICADWCRDCEIKDLKPGDIVSRKNSRFWKNEVKKAEELLRRHKEIL